VLDGISNQRKNEVTTAMEMDIDGYGINIIVQYQHAAGAGQNTILKIEY